MTSSGHSQGKLDRIPTPSFHKESVHPQNSFRQTLQVKYRRNNWDGGVFGVTKEKKNFFNVLRLFVTLTVFIKLEHNLIE